MTVKDRIMEFCRMSGIKPGRFERECGLSNAYLSKLKHEPSRDKLGKIFARYPELNKDWLLNGEGPMLNVVHYPAMEGGKWSQVCPWKPMASTSSFGVLLRASSSLTARATSEVYSFTVSEKKVSRAKLSISAAVCFNCPRRRRNRSDNSAG